MPPRRARLATDVWRIAILAVIAGAWEGATRGGLIAPFWVSSPSLVVRDLWRALTGADVSHLHAVPPLWTPDVACDARSAWVQNDGGVPVRLEAASWRGKPVWLRTIAPWERAERDVPMTPIGETGFGFFVVVAVALLPAFGVLARHNLRLGRSDTRGALRVGVTVFLCFALAESLRFRWANEPLRVWRWLEMQPYFPALVAWLFYLGVEPFLRRRWPHRLIAWTRLLEGRLADPLVGREVLLGFLAGAAAFLASCIPGALERRHDVEPLLWTLPIGRAADFWATIPASVGESLMKALGSFAILLLLRVILRRDAAAWVGLGLVWTLISLPSWNISAIEWISIVVAVAGIVLAVRVGLVAAIVATGTLELLAISTPLTLDFSRWYAWRTGVIAVLLLAIAVWGFRAAMGRRRILSAALLEG